MTDLGTKLGQEIKVDRTRLSAIEADLAELSSEVNTLIANTTSIDDTTTSLSKTWSSSKISSELGSIATVNVAGDTVIYPNQTKEYTITDYNAFSTYSASVSSGSVSITGSTITLTAPSVAGSVTLTITKDGASVPLSLTILPAGVITPTITSPTNGAINQKQTVTITANAFEWVGVEDTHASTTWQLATDALFTDIVAQSVNDVTNKTSWTTPNLLVSTTYYVRVLYTGNANGSSTYSSTVSFTTASSFIVISGVKWNPTSDTYIRTGGGIANNAHIVVASQMKRCVLQSNGIVAYYLHPTDSTKKADGTAADLSGATGNVMVEIPKFYFKYEWTGTEHHYSISDKLTAGYTVHPAFIKNGVEVAYRYYNAYNVRDNGTKLISASGVYPTTNLTRAQFRAKARANGTGWGLVDWNLYFAVQLLYLVEYADFNTQEVIGKGRTSMSGGSWADGSYFALSGLSNANGNSTANRWDSATAYGTNYMTYRGIEHWYGHLWKFVDGVNVQDGNYYVSNNFSTFADDVFSGDYVLKGTAAASNGYISNFAQDGDGLFPSAVAGSETTFVGDYYYYNSSNRVVMFGGNALSAGNAGAFYLYASDAASDALVSISAGLSF